MSKPYLRDYKKPERLADYPLGTCYEAGHLVTKNAGWRNICPKINDEKCVNCLQCYLYCPDGVIYKKENGIAIDYDFCKGCGICAKICRFGAIVMENEVKSNG